MHANNSTHLAGPDWISKHPQMGIGAVVWRYTVLVPFLVG
jgi:hypothetical protein